MRLSPINRVYKYMDKIEALMDQMKMILIKLDHKTEKKVNLTVKNKRKKSKSVS